jgi:hypothetical protein
MSTPFEIVIEEWISDEVSDPQMRATAAEISIRVGSHYVTEVEDHRAQTVRRSIRVSAGLMASWLLSNWWRLRWEPFKAPGRPENLDWQLSHSLAAAGGGYVWPPLTLASDGANVLVRCDGQTKSDSADVAPIRYLNSFSENVLSTNFERSVMGFVERVIERLDSTGFRQTLIHQLWAETLAERQNLGDTARRKLEALLGLDPDENDVLVSGLLSRWQEQVGKDCLEEIAAATESTSVENVLRTSERAATTVRTYAEIADFDRVKASLEARIPHNEPMPWQRGRKAAYLVREVWGLGTKPVPTEVIAARLNLSKVELDKDQGHIPFSFALRGNTDKSVGIVLSRRYPQSRRFDIARLIGDHLVFRTEDAWKPATRSLTDRQRFQRAFAAEFLCPSDELVRRYEGHIDLDDLDDETTRISEEFNVSQKLVLNHFANRNLIPRSVTNDGQSSFVENSAD